ncbi:hypothetical protein [Adhaeribacter aquaticus]|uniref:hypothetical protein n=1 Tax=Adhaeribacter aquaticus TaxID=299567 RepID=UPI00041E9342|nr:hypothetical protein [Adhaeribacter aquaticus]
MAILTTDVTYGGKANAEGLEANLFFKPVLETPELTSLGIDIREDVVTSEPLYKMIPADKVTKKKVGCGFNAAGNFGELIDDSVTVTELAVEMEQCAKDFDGTILQAMKKRGVDRNDLTGTALEQVLVDIGSPIIKRDLLRIALLGDTANASADYNQINGIWKKIFTGVADTSIKRVATLADNAMDAAGAAKDLVLAPLFFDAPDELQELDEASKIMVVTKSVYNNYLQYLASNNQLESSWAVLQNGLKTLTYFGVPVVPLGLVDRYLKVDFAPAGNIESPHRAWYTAINNITLATDLKSDFTTIDFWYEKKPQMNYLRVEYKLGAAIGLGELMAVAY